VAKHGERWRRVATKSHFTAQRTGEGTPRAANVLLAANAKPYSQLMGSESTEPRYRVWVTSLCARSVDFT